MFTSASLSMENSLIYKSLNFLHLFIKLLKNSLGPFISVLPSSINFFPYSKVFNEFLNSKKYNLFFDHRYFSLIHFYHILIEYKMDFLFGQNKNPNN